MLMAELGRCQRWTALPAAVSSAHPTTKMPYTNTYHEHGACSRVAHDRIGVQHCYVELLSNLQLRHNRALAVTSSRHLQTPTAS